MSSVLEKHRQAMEYADAAFQAKREGGGEQVTRLFRQAYALEREAAEQFAAEDGTEPTCSVLYRSAATLAVDCGEYREAERLIACALAGDPPFEIAEELRALLKTIYHSWRPAEVTAAAL